MAVVQKIDISSSTIFRTILILLSFWFLYLIRDVLLILIGAIVIASAIEPLAARLQKYRLPRIVSVLAVYIVLLAIIATAVTLVVPIVGEQTAQFAQALPHVIQSLPGFLGQDSLLTRQDVVAQAQSLLGRFGQQLTSASFDIVQQTRNVFTSIVSVIFAFIIALYLVIEEDALIKIGRLVVPLQHQGYVAQLISRMQYKVGRWVLGQVTLALIIGVSVGIGLWLIGVPYALVLGLVAGLLEVIPVIGPISAAIPGVLVAFSQSLWLGVAVIVVYIVVQQVESHVLIPNVMRKATGLNPLVILLAVLLGARLAGIVGVILSVPLATVISIFLSDVFNAKNASVSS